MTSILIAPTTELEAVNTILRSISEAPINTLVGNLPLEATRAQQKLHEQLRVVLSKGWSFNTDQGVVLSSTGGTSVTLPPNMLDVQNLSPSTYVVRGLRIYDPSKRSYILPLPVTADLIIGLSYEELPEPFRYYVFISASDKFQHEVLGEESRERFDRPHIMSAWVAVMNWESRRKAYNLSTNQSVRRSFRRRGV